MVTCLITGASLYAYLESLAEKVVVVISADLAHTHLASGPYGYSNASEPFDKVRGGVHWWPHRRAENSPRILTWYTVHSSQIAVGYRPYKVVLSMLPLTGVW